MSTREKLKFILEHYGIRKQIIKSFEELAELQVELAHYLRHAGDKEKIAGEIADVLCMLEQIEIGLGIGEQVRKTRLYKIDRQVKRIEESGKAENR